MEELHVPRQEEEVTEEVTESETKMNVNDNEDVNCYKYHHRHDENEINDNDNDDDRQHLLLDQCVEQKNESISGEIGKYNSITTLTEETNKSACLLDVPTSTCCNDNRNEKVVVIDNNTTDTNTGSFDNDVDDTSDKVDTIYDRSQQYIYINPIQQIMNTSIPNLLYSRQTYGSFSICNNNRNNNNNIKNSVNTTNNNNITYTRSMSYNTNLLSTTERRRTCNRQYHTQQQQQSYIVDRYQNYVASRIAWSPERMQNMIIAVGPNTPATFCWRDYTKDRPIAINGSVVDDDEDDNDDDHSNEEEEEEVVDDEDDDEELIDSDVNENMDEDDNDENDDGDDGNIHIIDPDSGMFLRNDTSNVMSSEIISSADSDAAFSSAINTKDSSSDNDQDYNDNSKGDDNGHASDKKKSSDEIQLTTDQSASMDDRNTIGVEDVTRSDKICSKSNVCHNEPGNTVDSGNTTSNNNVSDNVVNLDTVTSDGTDVGFISNGQENSINVTVSSIDNHPCTGTTVATLPHETVASRASTAPTTTLTATSTSSSPSSSSSSHDNDDSKVNQVCNHSASSNDHSTTSSSRNMEENVEIDDNADTDTDDDDDHAHISVALVRLSDELIRTSSARSSSDIRTENSQPGFLPSIRHTGCINTACWLQCPWKLSTSEKFSSTSNYSTTSSPASGNRPWSVIASSECPTQIVTSGDDKLIKFWDVRNSLGIANPLPGGYDTFCPYADYSTAPPMLEIGKEWRKAYRRQRYHKRDTNNDEDCGVGETHTYRPPVAGEVSLLASIRSGHRGNVFHVTPINEKPGQILSCAADGFLRLVNLEKDESSIVISPYPDDEDSMLSFFINGGMSGIMAFSHVLLTANTGLLCSERGLHLFDLRLPPRQQQRQSLLQSTHRDDHSTQTTRSKACKACAIWSPNGYYDTDPTYVFAGRADPVVELFDIRMSGTNDSQRKIIERYQPRHLRSCEGANHVSVSGLDVTKDGKELLVSYEHDQIYTFPILHTASSCPAGPTLEDIDAMSNKTTNDPNLIVSELASYGGHLNRFTFLKSPTYAGPNDEYICIGSDSGHAWIYDKYNGAVTSFLAADASTCNGVIPHPTLPYFITYGIASTAKIWRACPPIDPHACNSSTGKRKALLNEKQYETSPVTKTWQGVQQLVDLFDEREPAMLPDFVPMRYTNAAASSRNKIHGPDSPIIGNAIQNLPHVLMENRYECYRAFHSEEQFSWPIEQPIKEFSHHVAIHRLKAQATSLGAAFNRTYPWMFVIPNHERECTSYTPADLVPDYPSDWILLDSNMSLNVIDPMLNFNTTDYPDIIQSITVDEIDKDNAAINTTPWLRDDQRSIENYTDALWPTLDNENVNDFMKRSRKMLLETAIILKEAGNIAMKSGSFTLATKYYDKTIQYCALAFMEYSEGLRSLRHLANGHHKTVGMPETTIVAVWSPLLHLLITTRLNLALLFLKPEVGWARGVSDQIRHALKLLDPFARQDGQVVYIYGKKVHVISNAEPSETFHEARALQAKAYFRLGSAELETQNYGAAVKCFELSMKSSESALPNQKPDSLLVKRLREAKRMHSNKKIRDRKRYQRLVASDDD